jgi:hypothetical protein
MRKILNRVISTFLLILSFFSGIVSASWIVEKEVDGPITKSNEPICYNKDTSVKYVTLNAGLQNATSGQSIYVIPGSTVTVTNSITVKNGVSFYVPYKDELWDIQADSEISSSSFIDTNAQNVATYRKSQIIFTNGADLTVESGANVYLGGIFGSRGINNSYCEITLNSGSSINCSGSFYCYGYIKELNGINANQNGNQTNLNNECDSNRFFQLNSGGYLKTAIAIHDPGSTGQMKTYSDNKVCPLNIIEFPNIQTFMNVLYGATFVSQLRLVMGSGSNLYYTNEEAIILNKTSDSNTALFRLSSGSMAFEYCPANILYTSYSTAINNSPTRVYLHGSANLGSLHFSVSLVISQTIDTSTMFLPISHKMLVFVCNGAIFNSQNDIKFLPGAKVEVENGGTFNVNADLMVYSSAKFSEVASSTYPQACRSSDAQFINNGLLVVSSSATFGGPVSTTTNTNSAVVNLSSASQTSLRVSLPEGETGITLSSSMYGLFYDEVSQNVKEYQFAGNSTVTSYSNSQNLDCWVGSKYAVGTLSVIVNNLYSINFAEYQVYQADDSSGTNQIELTSGAFKTTKSFDVVQDKYFKVTLSGKEAGSSFTALPSGTSYSFSSGSWFKMNGDTTITITPSQGCILQIYTQGISGAGSSSVTVKTSSSQSGTYSTYKTFSPSGNDILLAGTWIQLSFTGGYNRNFKQVEVKAAYKKTISAVESPTATEPSSGTNGYTSFTFGSNFQLNDSTLVYIAIQAKSGCVSADSMISLANGIQKKASDISVGDLVKTWNFEKGCFEAQPVIYAGKLNQIDGYKITLHFTDGSKSEIINQQSYFSVDKLDYQVINHYTVSELIGMRVLADSAKVKTISYYDIEQGVYDAVGILTAYNLNFISDDLLTCEGLIAEHTFFAVDQNFKYIQLSMQEDIAEYGLYSYEEWSDLVTEEQFEMLLGKYYKVYVGKGYATYEYIRNMVAYFGTDHTKI